MIQAAAGNASVPGVVVGRRLGRSGADRPGTLPAQVQDAAAVRHLHRADRREQGLRRAVRVLPALRRHVPARHRPGAGWQRRHGRPETPAHPSPRLSRRRRTSSTGWRRPTCSSCRRISKACRWSRSKHGRSAGRCSPTGTVTCCAASASAAMPGCTTTPTRSSSRPSTRSSPTARCTRGSGRNGRDFFKRHYAWPVIERKYLDMFEQLRKGHRPAAPQPRRSSHCPAGSRGGSATCRRRRTCLSGSRPGRSRRRGCRAGRQPRRQKSA